MKRGGPLKRNGFPKRANPMKTNIKPGRAKLRGHKAELIVIDDGLPIPKAPPRPKKKKPVKRPTKYARRERDIDYMLLVKGLECILARNDEAGPCTGVTEADHAGLDAGLNQKAPDDTCIPLCSGHHLDRHACTGYFRGREKAWKRDWRLVAIEITQRELAHDTEGITW